MGGPKRPMQAKSTFRELAEAFAIAAILTFIVIAFVAQSFLVQGGSMLPSLVDGERLLVDKVTYRLRQPHRGEIVVFRYPSDPERKFIKRVIGVSGDEVEVREWTVYLNGKPLHEEYIQGPTYSDYGPVVVPEGTLFVLGDNRNQSEDSRYADVGFVPRSNVIGRAIFRFWPPGRFGRVAVPDIFHAQ